ncbi:MAG: methionyl-tRNA formyltransferase [Candidatus Magasanikbacteria bacterium RIFOXYC2_FULL_42_28]|uniref:Methionyl-tRNA formyltransferase n=1 Tax=Candidatus Magasanikbacteria bacterium RIFOXYC2_FULL_42_28 TaxID=1798704 RepID=A0A1F6NXZ7_9BACT|nr:MAG: methionyl-tRNA formyltransferase [Candidatus Magasanikbacteria bacterium RIFOXYC2_FULL_42_28]
MKTAIAYFGTEQFAAEILTALIESDKFEIKFVVTQPDRPVGRKQELQKSPVKLVTEKFGIKIEQPDSLKNWKLEIGNWKLNIVCQYGLIIPKNIIDAPTLGSINVHPSLLPKYRGASPIQSAIINGETKTGVSIMIMDEKMDHGDILAQQEIAIAPDDTFPILHNKLLEIAKPLIVNTAQKWVEQKIKPIEQNHNEATFCKMFTRENGRIDWKKSAREIYNLYRGLQPWPGIFTTADGKRIKLLKIVLAKKSAGAGEIIFKNQKLFVGCGEGAIEILELQNEGKNALSATAWINGNKNINKFE